MTYEEMCKAAIEKVKEDNPGSTQHLVSKAFENVMDGTVLSVKFITTENKEDSNHILFRGKELRSFRWHSDVLNAVSAYKERRWFFRLIELAGVNGVIAFVLILIFSGLLCAILLKYPNTYEKVLEVVKLSFSVILGYFFGSQASSKKGA